MKTKMKTPEKPKRKRAKIRAQQETHTGPDAALPDDKALTEFYRYLRDTGAAQMLAATARRLGNPHASPQDFACGCMPSPRDGAPLCSGVSPGCGQEPNGAAPEDFTEAEHARYNAAYQKAMNAWRPPKRYRFDWLSDHASV